MHWQRQVVVADVDKAYEDIEAFLSTAEKGLYVIVDISADPVFPLSATLRGALGPHRNPRLLGWVVIGSNAVARLVARMLNTTNRKQIIHWVDSYADAITFVEKKRNIVG
jgi:fructose-specific component phosphotransferase system IIB-like protein